tara:strand:- start:245 stop:880 length:636 start_codon:yes stop_codon:yes gene_type:complete
MDISYNSEPLLNNNNYQLYYQEFHNPTLNIGEDISAQTIEGAINFINIILNTWVNGGATDDDALDYDIMTHSMEQDGPAYKKILSSKGEENIQYISFSSEKYPNQNKCPIAMNTFQEGEVVAKLLCNHIFQKDSILKWLKEESASCPICRMKFDSTEVKVEKNNTPITQPSITQPGINFENFIMSEIVHIQNENELENIQRALLASLENSS